MKTLIFAALMTLSLHIQAQTADKHTYDVSTDAKNGSLIFKGEVTLSDLAHERSFTWFQKGMEQYKPDKESITFLKYYLPKYQIITFLGTWCEDSHNVIPKLARVIQETGTAANLTMYGVDREKWSGNGQSKKYGVSRVPAIILMQDGREVGRINEYPNESVETDLAWMIDKDIKSRATAHQ